MRLRPEEHEPVARYIHSLCGVSLDQSKAYLMEGRLASLVDETGSSSFSGLVARAKADPSRALDRRIVDAITTNETLFFRDIAPFELLRNKIVPEWIDRQRAGPRRLRIWSAACSMGQEVYSIAILLKELLGDTERYGIRILGTDISDAAIARASRGLFSEIDISRGLSEELRQKYFQRTAAGWQITDQIRAMVSFQKLNLLQDFSALGRFEIVLCRNVAIYFMDRDRVSLFARIERALEPQGCLIVGAMESLASICPQFESRSYLRSVFYQLKTAGSGRQVKS
jgi:chemotaxis protein methyltransferase CheR